MVEQQLLRALLVSAILSLYRGIPDTGFMTTRLVKYFGRVRVKFLGMFHVPVTSSTNVIMKLLFVSSCYQSNRV